MRIYSRHRAKTGCGGHPASYPMMISRSPLPGARSWAFTSM